MVSLEHDRRPVHRHGDVVAREVRQAAARLPPQVGEACRFAARRDMEATADEEPVERRNTRLAALGDGREGDVPDPLEVRHDLAR